MRAVVVLLVGLGGCTLVDQNTFNSHAGDAPVIPPAKVAVAAPVQVGPPPLVVIAGGEPSAYRDALTKAVASARARKPGVMFDVVEMQPADLAADAPIGAGAAGVARTIVDAGVPAERVRLAARPEAGVRAGEVRVYVR